MPGDPGALQDHLRGRSAQSEPVPEERHPCEAMGLSITVCLFWIEPVYGQSENHSSKSYMD